MTSSRLDQLWTFPKGSVRHFALMSFLVVASLSCQAQDLATEIARIEAGFVRSRDTPIVNSIANIPADVIERFDRIVPWDDMADFGELWNSGDVVTEDIPHSQHVFSGISNEFIAIVYLEGGYSGRSVMLLLAERNVPGVCFYALGSGSGIPSVLDYLRQAVQGGNLLRNREVVKCRYEPD